MTFFLSSISDVASPKLRTTFNFILLSTSGCKIILMSYKPNSFMGLSKAICLLPSVIPFSPMRFAISLVVTDPYNIPVSDADLTIIKFKDSTSVRNFSAFSISSLFFSSKFAFVVSKNSLFSEVNKFNETKQLLAQIKVLENNKNLEMSANDFLKNLSENNISFEQKGDSTVIPGLSKLDALEIMTNIEENNVAIESFTFSVDDSSSIILSINFDG